MEWVIARGIGGDIWRPSPKRNDVSWRCGEMKKTKPVPVFRRIAVGLRTECISVSRVTRRQPEVAERRHFRMTTGSFSKKKKKIVIIGAFLRTALLSTVHLICRFLLILLVSLVSLRLRQLINKTHFVCDRANNIRLTSVAA